MATNIARLHIDAEAIAPAAAGHVGVAAGAQAAAGNAEHLPDMRYRALLGAAAWNRLPAAVQARFAKRLRPGVSVTYTGVTEQCEMRLLGRILAQCCRVIGAPLPLYCGSGAAAVVTVTEDGQGGGQVWSRMYTRPDGFPQVIHSAKRFAGATGLEEYLGAGFGIALRVEGDAQGIRFLNDHYFLKIGKWRMKLPDWLAPGRLVIEHRDEGEGAFAFILNLRHPMFGVLIHQHCRFYDQINPDAKGA